MLTVGKQASQGIIADGFLRYMAADGKEYEVTMEATSHGTREEILFKPLPSKLNWDAIVLASWGTVMSVGILLETRWLIWEKGGPWFYWLLVLSIWSALFLSFRTFARSAKRYRYIYAIEQFKAYHTDDQWIAIGEDVFTYSQDPYLAELKRQCIDTGVGLLMVKASGEVDMIMASARGTLDLGQRKRINFLERSSQWLRPMERSAVKVLSRPFEALELGTARDLMRFRPKQWKQFSFSVLAWVVLIIFTWRFYIQNPIRAINRQELKALAEQAASRQPLEPDYFIIDSAFIIPYGREVGQYLRLRDSLEYAQQPIQLDYVEPPVSGTPLPGLMVLVGVDSMVNYPCSRVAGLDEEQFALVESTVASPDEARVRMVELSAIDLETKALRLSCVQDEAKGYLVFWELGFSSRQEAENALERYQTLQNQNDQLPNLAVMQLQEAIPLANQRD